ncbi:MAG: response regulator [Anaerolineae bacterium]
MNLPTEGPPMDRKTLRLCLERAMASYYHGAKLARNPLCDLLDGIAPGSLSDPAALRALLREALESLRPPDRTPSDDPSWLPYRVATLHYLQSQSRGIVCAELGISQTTFYRHRRRALDDMTTYLWQKGITRASKATEGKPAASDVLARSVSAAIGQHREPLDLAEVMRGVQAILAHLASAQESPLQVKIDPTAKPVQGDPVLLRQVILNLATDALRELPGRTIALRIGIRGDSIEGSCEPFPYAASKDPGHSGVAAAQQLVETAGGQLELHATPPRAVFRLPLTRQPLVLCLDDDPDAARLYGLYLSRAGYRVRGVTTGEELLETLDRELPNVILLDILMPREDGWAILEELQQQDRTREIPIVVCSVLQQPDLALSMGAAAVLTKPVSPDLLQRTLAEVLGDAPGSEATS